VFDLWVQQWRKRRAQGDVIVVRYADDFIVGFQHRAEAEQFLCELKERFAQFNLELHPDKTRLIEFGRFADRRGRGGGGGGGKPPTFHFLGFTHICARSAKGWFWVMRHTMRTRMQAKLRDVKEALRRRMHATVPEQGRWLASVIRGHQQYFAVPGNSRAVATFRQVICRTWHKVLQRRSQNGGVSWARFNRYVARWLPPQRMHHPYPARRLVV